jgi:hypothetical protein
MDSVLVKWNVCIYLRFGILKLPYKNFIKQHIKNTLMMKRYTIAKAFALLATLFATNALIAQQARVQIIHNAAGIALDTVDVYVNDQLLDNVAFRTATGILRLSPGSYNINLNHKSSADSGDQVLARFTVNLVANAANFGHLIMVTGVEDPSNYEANPDSRNTGVELIIRRNVAIGTTNQTIAPSTIIHASTDAPGVNITTRPSSSVVNLSNVRYGDTTGNVFLPAQESFIDVTIHSSSTLFKSYIAPLQLFPARALTVFASGFVNPAANQNGSAFGLFVVDTNGGAAIPLSEGFRVQFINTSTDTSISAVDIWQNSVRIRQNLNRLQATPMLNLTSGNNQYTVTRAGSPNENTDVLFSTDTPITINSGESYIVFVSGVVDTNAYPTNPDGLDRSLALIGFNNFNESVATIGQFDLQYFNSITNASSIELNRGAATVTPMFNATAYAGLSNRISLTTIGNNAYILRENIDGELIRTYRLLVPANYANRVATLVSVGFKKDDDLPEGALLSSYQLVFTNGEVVPLTELNAFIQIVHASADPSIAEVDVYINGEKILDNFGFSQATPFLPVVPYKTLAVGVAPANSTSATEAFFTTNVLADSSRYHYAVASGLRNITGFAANPNNVDRSFALLINNTARLDAALNTKNIDLMYFHSMTDAPATEAQGRNQTSFLSRNNNFKTFHGYRAHSAFNEIPFELIEFESRALLYRRHVDLLSHQGKTGLVIATGFKNPAQNQNGRGIEMFIIWPEGAVDSFYIPTSLQSAQQQLLQFVAYPNPASEQIKVAFHSHINAQTAIEMYDLSGKLLQSFNKTSIAGYNEMELNVANFTNGLYIIKVTNGETTGHSKITITR